METEAETGRRKEVMKEMNYTEADMQLVERQVPRGPWQQFVNWWGNRAPGRNLQPLDMVDYVISGKREHEYEGPVKVPKVFLGYSLVREGIGLRWKVLCAGQPSREMSSQKPVIPIDRFDVAVIRTRFKGGGMEN